jgi:hypothetical protein
MRVEQAYPGDALHRLWHEDGIHQFRRLVYCTAGEEVLPGAYHCTFCGGLVQLRRQVPLPLCPVCDSAEFIADVRADVRAEIRAEVRLKPSALDQAADAPAGVGALAA